MLLAALLLAILPPSPADAQAPTLTERDPIILQGDADFCDRLDATGAKDDDGVINCDTADGSPDAPYVLAGWSIEVTGLSGCQKLLPSACGLPAPCASSSVPAAIAVCNTTKHLVLRDLLIINEEGVRDIAPQGAGNAVQTTPAAGILLAGASNVRLHDVDLRAAGAGLYITETSGPLGRIAATNILVERVDIDPVPQGADNSAIDVPMVLILDADVTLRHVNVTASLPDASAPVRSIGFRARVTPGLEGQRRLVIESSRIKDATESGILLRGYVAELRANDLIRNGRTPHFQDSAAYTVDLDTGNYVLLDNRFVVDSVGIGIDESTLRAHHNDFRAGDPNAPRPTAIHQAAGDCSKTHITYNDFNGLTSVNNQAACPLYARFNYWGANNNPPSGFDSTPVLPLPTEALPRVNVAGPVSGADVHGKFIIDGTADPNEAGALQRVEATDTEDQWGTNTTADGLTAWALTWDASTTPTGPLTIWIRACATDACGVPHRLDLNVVERPLPPIALLEARPRVANVDEEIVLDATASYSPQARPIAAYRFDLGNGQKTEWGPEPIHTIRYQKPGEYPTSVEVLDLAGFESTNLPQATVRVLDPDDAGAGGAPLPGPSALVCLAGIGLLVLLRRRHP